MDREQIGRAVDRLENCVESLTTLRMLPDSIHVGALREQLPEIIKALRAAMDADPT